MKEPAKLINIINEEIQNIETEVDKHAHDQVKARLDTMANNGDITSKEANELRRNLKNIVNHNFDSNDYGIFLGSFVPNPNSLLYTDKNQYDPGIPFYQIFSNDGVFAKDSTGDEMWGIVRDHNLKTVMLRKNLQSRSAGKARNDDGGLGVDVPIFNFDAYLQKIENQQQRKEQEKLHQQQKALEKQKAQEKMKNIHGVWWVIDDKQEIVHKKNKPSDFVSFDDVIEYPNWSEEIKNDIINRMN